MILIAVPLFLIVQMKWDFVIAILVLVLVQFTITVFNALVLSLSSWIATRILAAVTHFMVTLESDVQVN